MAVRVEGFVRAVLVANDDPAFATAGQLLHDGKASGAPARGLACSAEVLSTLRRCAERLGVALRRELATMVEAWCDDCLKKRQLGLCCTLYAHLAFCYKHVDESELDYQAVSTLLCAQVRHTPPVCVASRARHRVRSRSVHHPLLL